VIVPNKDVWGSVITNATGTSERRVDMVFGIGYSDDIGKAQEILERIVSEQEEVLEEPAPTIKMHELADSSVNFIVRPWVKTADYWTVHWNIMRRVKEEFDANGISIPFPQRDVHVHQVTSG
jgi:small conductance mechanosensitive channel